MSERRRYRCRICDHRFEVDVLTPEEKHEAERQHRPVFPVTCPVCFRTEVHRVPE
jgi:hypothetical protein